MSPKRRRRFSREFKLEAVRLVTEQGAPVKQVCRDLDLRPDMLRRWRRQFEQDPEHSFPGTGQAKPVDAELRRLRRENQLLREERRILKKALAIFSERPR